MLLNLKALVNDNFIYLAVFSVNLVSIYAGATFSWPSSTIPKLHNITTTPLSEPTTLEQEAWITGLVNLGGALSPIFAGYTSDKIGKKKTLLLFGISMITAHVLYIIAFHVNCFLIGAFISGIGVGCVLATLPDYVSEIAEDRHRGLLGSVMGININFGTLLSYLLGPFMSIACFSYVMLVILLIFYIVFGLLIPESPYYYVSMDNRAKAQEVLMKFRAKKSDQVEKELNSITDYITSYSQTSDGNNSIVKFMHNKSIRKALFITNALVLFQQLCGIGAVLGYMETIFEAAGSNLPGAYSAIIIGSLQFCTTAISSNFVDKLGRRFLIIISSVFSFISLLSLGVYFYLQINLFDVSSISWLPIASLTVFIIGFSSGLSSIPWVVMGEIFPANFSAYGGTITVSMAMWYSFAATMSFPFVNEILGMAGSFWLFSIVLAFGIVFSIFVMPETKGKSFIEIQEMLGAVK